MLLIAGLLLGLCLGAAAGWLAATRSRPSAPASSHAVEVAAMTAGLAHEIKNPLSTIGMNAQLLDEAIADLKGDEHEIGRVRRRIATLVRETDRLRGILTDFLEFAGEMRLHTTRVDLNEVVDEIGDFFLPEAQKAGVRLRVERARRPVWVLADVPLLKQAMLNLMLNATQAMAGQTPGAGGGELILRVAEHKRTGRAEAQAHVIDTGPGISDEQRARVFEPYYTTKGGGTGLGLPTARRIAHAHGGRLDLISEVGRGSDFVLILPPAGDPEP